jgi:hypothetical protein
MPPFRPIRALRNAAAALAGSLGLLLPGSGGACAASLHKIETGRPATATFLLQGPITAGDTRQMAAALGRLPAGTAVSVILDSPGGHLGEGLMLGTLFHEKRVTTVARGDGAICYSACALAFLGGRSARTGEPMRVKMSGGKLGFHQFSRRNFDPLKIYTKADYDAQVVEAQQITRDVVRYLKHIGEDLSKLQLMLRAPSDGMNVISNDESLASGFHILDEATGRLTEAGPRRQQVSAVEMAGARLQAAGSR